MTYDMYIDYIDVFILWYTSSNVHISFAICVRHRKRHSCYPDATGGFSKPEFSTQGQQWLEALRLLQRPCLGFCWFTSQKNTSIELSMIFTVEYIERISMFLCFCPENPVINSYKWSRRNVD